MLLFTFVSFKFQATYFFITMGCCYFAFLRYSTIYIYIHIVNTYNVYFIYIDICIHLFIFIFMYRYCSIDLWLQIYSVAPPSACWHRRALRFGDSIVTRAVSVGSIAPCAVEVSHAARPASVEEFELWSEKGTEASRQEKRQDLEAGDSCWVKSMLKKNLRQMIQRHFVARAPPKLILAFVWRWGTPKFQSIPFYIIFRTTDTIDQGNYPFTHLDRCNAFALRIAFVGESGCGNLACINSSIW